MGTSWFAVWGILSVFQAPLLLTAQEPTCRPGFQSDQLVFSTINRSLRRGTILGKVGFTDCTDRTRFAFSTSDSRFIVKTDGVLMVNRPVVLHEGHQDFLIHSWDSQGRKMTVSVTVSTSATDPKAADLRFPRSSEGLKRRKRDWVIPDIHVVENRRGTHPYQVAQIRISADSGKIQYSITGPGADQPPVGIFTIDSNTGALYVTQPLDREQQAMYRFQVHAVAESSGNAEEPIEITVIVIDQNDNKPVFSSSTLIGEVPEASVTGFEVIKVEATDADEPNSDNSDIRYRIVSQEPQQPSANMFEINPVNGVIRLAATGLDRQKYPEYTLVVEAADMLGEGLNGQANVILKVTEGSLIPDIFVSENKRDPHPLKLSQFSFSTDETKKFSYSITGPGADQPPVGLFTVDRDTGNLYVTQPLDREQQTTYRLQVRAVAEGAENDVILNTVTIKVTDQNDNKPVFTLNTFAGQVAENSVQGSEVIKVEATDADEPNSDNSDIRYRIVSQEPQQPSDNMFEINPVNGVISLAGTGLDRQRYPQYTLVVEAADMSGLGLNGQASVVIKVVENQ